MDIHEFLFDFLFFLGVTITLVPLFKFINLSPILAYLLGGIILGPSMINVIHDLTGVFKLAELGVILLLFVIGLEVSPRRLSQLRNKIIIDGGIQVFVTTSIFMLICHLFKVEIIQSLIISIALSLSSTAFVLEYLKDSKQLTLSHGQMCFSILLFQDIVIIPLLAFLPFFAPDVGQKINLSYEDFFIRTSLLFTLLLIGRYIVKPVVAFVKNYQTQEIFTATCLFLVISMALMVDSIGLSKPIGAFLAGIFLSDSEFHVEVETVIHPIKVMLIGIFFMAFGIEIKVSYILSNLQTILLLSAGYIFLKFIILVPLGRIILKNYGSGVKLGLLLCQGGEFGIVIVTGAYTLNIINAELNIIIVSIFTISLLVAPILAKLSESINSSSS